MDLELFDVTPSGRIVLGDLLKGVKYAQATKNADGTVTISPVTIRGARGKSAALPEDQPIPGTEPTDEAPFS